MNKEICDRHEGSRQVNSVHDISIQNEQTAGKMGTYTIAPDPG